MKRADELRTEILPKYLEKTNCFNYEVDWLGMSGQNMEAYDNYIMSLVVDVYKVQITFSATTLYVSPSSELYEFYNLLPDNYQANRQVNEEAR